MLKELLCEKNDDDDISGFRRATDIAQRFFALNDAHVGAKEVGRAVEYVEALRADSSCELGAYVAATMFDGPIVQIHGLKTSPKLNGKIGFICLDKISKVAGESPERYPVCITKILLSSSRTKTTPPCSFARPT